ncbi:acetylornithine/succinylornithine family transaminase, partial [Legionella drancourtii]|uniref:acetylornithine/succinylornithine family transaminase n=1 Tax=Legionella drancourtii TaxID=168933 RepID=UPI00058CE682
FEHGKGVWLFDKNNKKYIDGVTGIGVSALGHSHPAIIKAITEQANKILFIGNMFHIEEQEKLGDEFIEISKMHQVVFVNSGTEASEVSIKMARNYGYTQGIKNPTIIVFKNGFHGRTIGSLSASGNFKLQEGFGPLLPGFIFVDYNDIDAVRKLANSGNEDIIGVSLEPILGQGGVVIPGTNFLKDLNEICKEKEWLLILDEIQTGMGRTGKFFAYQHEDLSPDIITTAKCIAGGLPLGACAANKKVSDVFLLGKHGTTFGGNPLSCHVARTVIKTIKDNNLLENITSTGAYLLEQLKTELSALDIVVDIRGKGMMLGIELAKPCHGLYLHGLEAGVLFNIAAEKVIRILPPYIMNKEEADIFVQRLKKAIVSFCQDKAQ